MNVQLLESAQSSYLQQVARERPIGYPSWAKECLHRDLERVGPTRYGLESLLPFRLPEQDGAGVGSDVVYEFLKTHGMLRFCLSLSDGDAFVANPEEFRRQFGDLKLLLWKSVLREWGDEDLDDDEGGDNWGDGGIHVPVVFYDPEKKKVRLSRIEIGMVIRWDWVSPMFPAASCL